MAKKSSKGSKLATGAIGVQRPQAPGVATTPAAPKK